MTMDKAPTLNLPDSRSPLLELDLQTKEEATALRKQNGAAWRGALGLDAYLRREEHLSRQELSRDGGLTAWVLVDKAAEERRVLCACETLKKRALVSQNGKVRDVVCHGVGSVFCPSEFRRQGYAARMMRELGTKLQNWQTEDQECLFSILYSDIGKEFYAARGWEPFNSAHISVPYLTAARIPDQLPSTRPLYAPDLVELCAVDEGLLRESIKSSGERPVVAQIPNVETIRWHHAREEFVSRELYGKQPVVKGAVVGDLKGTRAWATWTRMWYNENPNERENNTMHILRLVLEDDRVDLNASENRHINGEPRGTTSKHVRTIAALLTAAQAEAVSWNMSEVEIWNPSQPTIAAAQLLHAEAKVIHRDTDSIACLRWYGSNPPLERGATADYVDWVGNEKYGWC